MPVCCEFYAAPRIDGQCELKSSTNRSLTFRWTPAKSATTYHLVGHSRSTSTRTNTVTVDYLTPGTNYAFIVWAVGSQELASNNVTCTGSTGTATDARFARRFSGSRIWKSHSGVLGRTVSPVGTCSARVCPGDMCLHKLN